jgi:hypothetical protein
MSESEVVCSKCGKTWKKKDVCPECGAPCHPRILIVEDADMLRELKGILLKFDRDNIPMRQTRTKRGAGVNVNISHRQASRIRQLISTVESHSSYKADLAELVLDLWHFIENVTPEDPTRSEKFFALRERIRKLERRM